MKWNDILINEILKLLIDESKRGDVFEKLFSDSKIGIHLAVFNEPYLSLLYNGEKKIESRFSVNKISPYMKIQKGDIVILKESGGFVTGIFIAGKVKFFHKLSKTDLINLKTEYGDLICSGYDKNFWKKKQNANYASLIEIKKVKKLPAIKSKKKDRRGWIVLRNGVESENLFKYPE